jgi:hypothetical protein
MTGAATVVKTRHLGKELPAFPYVVCKFLLDVEVLRRGLCRPHEVREGIDVSLGVFSALALRAEVDRFITVLIIRNIIKSCDRAAQGRVLIDYQEIRYAHFVKIGVSGKREQTRHLVLPAKTADATFATG